MEKYKLTDDLLINNLKYGEPNKKRFFGLIKGNRDSKGLEGIIRNINLKYFSDYKYTTNNIKTTLKSCHNINFELSNIYIDKEEFSANNLIEALEIFSILLSNLYNEKLLLDSKYNIDNNILDIYINDYGTKINFRNGLFLNKSNITNQVYVRLNFDFINMDYFISEEYFDYYFWGFPMKHNFNYKEESFLHYFKTIFLKRDINRFSWNSCLDIKDRYIKIKYIAYN